VKPLIVDVETAGAAHRRLLRGNTIKNCVVDVDAKIRLRPITDGFVEGDSRAKHPQHGPRHAQDRWS
jgi:hypothetical protein